MLGFVTPAKDGLAGEFTVAGFPYGEEYMVYGVFGNTVPAGFVCAVIAGFVLATTVGLAVFATVGFSFTFAG